MNALVAAACVLLAVVLAGGSADAAGRRLTRLSATAPARPVRRALRRRVAPAKDGADAALLLDLVAAAMAGGAHPAGALRVVGEAVGGEDGRALRGVADRMALGADEASAWDDAPAALAPLRHALALCAATGAPAARLLTERADDVRRRRQRDQLVAAQRLGVRVVLPLGLCALPGFAAWGVVPVVLGLARDLLGS